MRGRKGNGGKREEDERNGLKEEDKGKEGKWGEGDEGKDGEWREDEEKEGE